MWRTKLASVGGLPTHPSDIGGFIPSPDLNGHSQPLFLDGQMILAAGDLFAIDLNDGSLRWRAKLKASIPNLKNTYAQPILAGDVLYAACRGAACSTVR
ncbi:MAG: PQQ-binding-like beta-propeller repeat protein [Proteobacteria bacterium]|nr:PQQ-binding-like beta-propeller repeat protein [Pseudomonadota bacterium]